MRSHPVLITDAERSQSDQLRGRQIRYASMMGLRIVCLVALVSLIATEAPLLWLWVPLCAVGMLLLPWMAVLIANDQPPKREHTLRGKLAGRRRAFTAAEETPGVTAVPHGGKVIDPEAE